MEHDIKTIIDVVFKKLALIYGRDFTSRWEGIDLDDVKSDWAHELSGFEKAPHAIKYALQNLPPKAPTVLEFRSIAIRAPAPDAPRLELPKSNPEIAHKAIAEARALLNRMNW